MAADGRLYSIKEGTTTTAVIGNETIAPFKSIFYGKNIWLNLGLIKTTTDVGSVIRIPAPMRLVGESYGVTESGAIAADGRRGQGVVKEDAIGQVENVLKFDRDKDSFYKKHSQEGLDLSLYTKAGELKARTNASMMKVGFNFATIRWNQAARAYMVADATKAAAQSTGFTTLITAAGQTQAGGDNLVKKLTDIFDAFEMQTDKFKETIPREELVFIVSPNLYSAISRAFTFGVRQVNAIRPQDNGGIPAFEVGGVRAYKDPMFLGRNIVAGMYHKTETVDLSKVVGYIFTKRFMDSWMKGTQMWQGQLQSNNNPFVGIKGMAKSQIFEEFGTEFKALITQAAVVGS